MADLIWLHDEALRASHPVLSPVSSQLPAVFIWDNAYFDAMHTGFKRRVFIYEALAELPVEIIRGDTLAVLTDLAGDGVLRTASSGNPQLRALIATLRQSMEVIEIDDDPLVRLSASPDLKRFFRYWNKARKCAMQPHGGTPDLFS